MAKLFHCSNKHQNVVKDNKMAKEIKKSKTNAF